MRYVTYLLLQCFAAVSIPFFCAICVQVFDFDIELLILSPLLTVCVSVCLTWVYCWRWVRPRTVGFGLVHGFVVFLVSFFWGVVALPGHLPSRMAVHESSTIDTLEQYREAQERFHVTTGAWAVSLDALAKSDHLNENVAGASLDRAEPDPTHGYVFRLIVVEADPATGETPRPWLLAIPAEYDRTARNTFLLKGGGMEELLQDDRGRDATEALIRGPVDVKTLHQKKGWVSTK